MKVLSSLVLTSAALFALSPALAADEPAKKEKPLERENIYIQIGAFVIGNTNTLMGAENSGLGAYLDTNQLLDMESSVTVARLDGYWRFTPNQRLEFAYYNINRTGTKILDQNIEWNGEVFAIGSNVNSDLKTTTYKLNYSWSFYRNEKVDLGIGAGLHVTQIDASLDGTAYTNPSDPNDPATEYVGAQTVKVLAPLPVVGFRISYNITDRLRIRGSTDIFALKFDGNKGNFRDTSLGLDWRFSKHVGVGGSIISDNLYLEATADNDTTLKIKNDVLGAEAFISFYF
jgi:hypothetical protein